jgi:hypothetical protein
MALAVELMLKVGEFSRQSWHHDAHSPLISNQSIL